MTQNVISPNTDPLSLPSLGERYERAASLEKETWISEMVLNSKVHPRWIGETDCFWYIRQIRRAEVEAPGHEYRLVDATANENKIAFNHEELARHLAKETSETVDPLQLPLGNIEFDLDKGEITFHAFERRWRYDGELTENEPVSSPNPAGLISPCGKYSVFAKDFNLWLHAIETGEERALTTNGEKHNAYAVQPEARDLTMGWGGPTIQTFEALWSPDSRYVLTVQTDERAVQTVPTMFYAPKDGRPSPKTVECKYALPGNAEIAKYQFVSINLETGETVNANYQKVVDAYVMSGPFSGNRAWWSSDGKTAYFLDATRGQKQVKVIALEAATGRCQTLLEEASETYVDVCPEPAFPAFLLPLPDTDELLWYSERSGWAHYYLYDTKSGELKNAVTKGNWLVRGIVHWDPHNREVWLTIAGRFEGRDPYQREVVRVNVDTGSMVVVASSEHDYLTFYEMQGSDAGISPTANYIVTTRCRVDEPSAAELRDRNGHLLQTIEEADVSGLPDGWNWPKSHLVKGDDDRTILSAAVFFPTHYDPAKKYPVLDFAIDAPMYSATPTGAFVAGMPGFGLSECVFVGNAFYSMHTALAELGFIVVAAAGRGTPSRSKEFHNADFGDFMQTKCTADHVAVIKQLSEIYPAMDLDRVGAICTDSPSNHAIHGLLLYPEFYKVGVAFSPWDPRLAKQGEIYHNILDSDAACQPYTEAYASHLEGKLLLVAGLRDPFFHASSSFQIVDALNKANKPFDMFFPPNGGHGCGVINGHCRAWDYVVEHLRGETPPTDFKLVTSIEHFDPQGMPENTAV